jgi:predicted nucleic acid-binding protein
MKAHRFEAIISDANVLIDYVKANKKILHLAVKHLCDIYVPIEVLKEVKDTTGDELEKLGISIFEPTLDQVINATKRPFGLSFEDQLCFLIAKEKGWVCATNDKQLRVQCEAGSVDVIWGLEIMALLNKEGHLDRIEVEKTVEKIGEINRYIGKDLIKRFIAKLI